MCICVFACVYLSLSVSLSLSIYIYIYIHTNTHAYITVHGRTTTTATVTRSTTFAVSAKARTSSLTATPILSIYLSVCLSIYLSIYITLFLPTKIIPTKICWLKTSGKIPMDMRTPPLKVKILLESNPPKLPKAWPDLGQDGVTMHQAVTLRNIAMTLVPGYVISSEHVFRRVLSLAEGGCGQARRPLTACMHLLYHASITTIMHISYNIFDINITFIFISTCCYTINAVRRDGRRRPPPGAADRAAGLMGEAYFISHQRLVS